MAVSIIDFAYSPATTTIGVGGTVTWTNSGSTAHTVTGDQGAFDSGNINPAGTFSFKFNTAGTYTYHCSIHPQMVGTIVVQ
jgi:plastocyanin